LPSPVADLIGFDRAMANVLIVEEGSSPARCGGRSWGAQAKSEALLAAAAELGHRRG
jgi:phosphoserine phosphatase